MVTKNSGAVGGTDSKIAAAMELNMTVVVVQRPPATGAETMSSVRDLLEYLKGSAMGC